MIHRFFERFGLGLFVLFIISFISIMGYLLSNSNIGNNFSRIDWYPLLTGFFAIISFLTGIVLIIFLVYGTGYAFEHFFMRNKK